MNKFSKREEIAAQKLGTHRNLGSGAWKNSKGDIATGPLHLQKANFLFEHKQTERASISLKIKDLEKIEREALQSLKSPGFIIHFENPGKLANDTWVAFPLDQLEKLE